MKSSFKIDQLLLFFLLAIGLLFLSFGEDLVMTDAGPQTALTRYFDIDHALSVPGEGQLEPGAEIRAYDPAVAMHYSLDGGQNFTRSCDNIVIDKVENADITRYPTSYYWKAPQGEFPVCKNIVIRLQNEMTGAITEEKVYSFFEDTLSLPVISLTTPQDNLVSEAAGIMVFGESSYVDEGFYKSWWDRSGNFSARGLDWEKEVYFQYFENGELQYEQACGLRISGNATRGFPQKSMQLIARRMYGNDRFAFPFFGKAGEKKYASLVVRNSGNDNTRTLFADLLMQRLAAGSNVLTQQGQPVMVYLNGNFWGIYNLRERIDEYFISRIEDVKDDEVTLLEGDAGELKDGSEDVKAEFDRLMERLDGAAIMTEELYEEVHAAIDLGSFMDYLVFETFYANNDWPSNNSMWYKAGDGSWKFIFSDLDYSLAYAGPGNINANLFQKLEGSNAVVGRLYRKLMTHPSFADAFVNRARQLIHDRFSDARLASVYEALKRLYEPVIKLQIDRWGMIPSVDAWETNCQSNYRFLMDRRETYLTQLSELR